MRTPRNGWWVGLAVSAGAAVVVAMVAAVATSTLPARAACAPPAGHSATLLADGRVLVTDSTEAALTNWAQIYDPATGRWSQTSIQRDGGVTATLLADGRVLLTGSDCDRYGPQIYDPRTDAVSSAGTPAAPGYFGYTTASLRDGRVLVLGGYGGPKDVNTQPQNVVQLFDPASHSWTVGPPMPIERMSPESLLLADGRVLVVGGKAAVWSPVSGRPVPPTPGPFLTSADIYDPQAGRWSSAGNLPTDIYGSAALSIIGDGMVLAAGGGVDGAPTAISYLFNPSSRNWSRTASMGSARSGGGTAKSADGSVVVVGGQGTSGSPLTNSEKFDPANDTWAVMPGALATSSLDQSVIPLKDGRILVAAWPDFVSGRWSSADVQVFDPRVAAAPTSPSPVPAAAGSWSVMPEIAAASGNFCCTAGGFSSTATSTLLHDGRVLVIGTDTIEGGVAAAIYDTTSGRSQVIASPTTITSLGFTATLLRDGRVLVVGGGAELFDPATGRWSQAAPERVARVDHTATLLSDGRVLIAGGLTRAESGGGLEDLITADIYDPRSNSWSGAAAMPQQVGGGGTTATLLRSGLVLVVAGYNASSMLYDPKRNVWSVAGSINEPAQVPHAALLLSDGRVLILGGCAEPGPAFGCLRGAVAEIFDPNTYRWSTASPMQSTPGWFSATLLRSGLVLVAGGYGPQSVVPTAELYDPAQGRWESAGEMKLARAGDTATLLPNGTVLVVGGFFLDDLRSVELYAPAYEPQKSAAGSRAAGNRLLAGAAAAVAILVMLALFVRRARRRRGAL